VHRSPKPIEVSIATRDLRRIDSGARDPTVTRLDRIADRSFANVNLGVMLESVTGNLMCVNLTSSINCPGGTPVGRSAARQFFSHKSSCCCASATTAPVDTTNGRVNAQNSICDLLRQIAFAALGASALVAVMVAAPAMAADLGPVKAPPAPAYAPYNWTGFHVGANIGGAWAGGTITNNANGASVGIGSNAAFIGGGQLDL
jgi:hypothetical protein